MKSGIEIYQSPNGIAEISVKFEQENVWLTQAELVALYQSSKANVSEHIRNIFEEGELCSEATVRKFRTVRQEGSRQVNRELEYYNLDMIISLGYRIKSQIATHFRIWATQRLKEHLVQGYSINEKRLKELGKIIELIENTTSYSSENDETKGLLSILSKYSKSFILLNQYDSNSLNFSNGNKQISYEIKYDEAINAISKLKKQLIEKGEATEIFGNQKDKSFEGILRSILQTFGGEYLYPNIEVQAAHLLYFIIKNHPFSDGNKRIGALLFVWFLQKNKYLLKNNGEIKINNNTLVALALLVAQSNPEEKDLMINLICNLIEC